MNRKQASLISELKNVLEEIDMQCIEDEDFSDKVLSMDIFSRNLNDIVEDLTTIE